MVIFLLIFGLLLSLIGLIFFIVINFKPTLDNENIERGIVEFNIKKAGLENTDNKSKNFVKYKDFRVHINGKPYIYTAHVCKSPWMTSTELGYSTDYMFKNEAGLVVNDKELHIDMFREVVLDSKDDYNMDIFLEISPESWKASPFFAELYRDKRI